MSERQLSGWYFLLCFITGIVVLFSCTILAFAIVMRRLSARSLLGMSGSIIFFLWATREMYRSYRGNFSN